MKRLTIILSLAGAITLAGCKDKQAGKDAQAEKPGAAFKLDSDKRRLSYAIGYSLGRRMVADGVPMDPDALALAIRHAATKQKPIMSPKEMMGAIRKFQKQRIERMRKAMLERNRNAIARKKLGEDFLAANSKKKGVVTLKSGLQYRVIKAGTGKSPKPTDTVVVHYTGRLVDGKVFDSSIKRQTPAVFRVNGVIKGWQEILPLMKEGARWEVFIPYQLAYGARGAGSAIGPYEALVFEINLIKVK